MDKTNGPRKDRKIPESATMDNHCAFRKITERKWYAAICKTERNVRKKKKTDWLKNADRLNRTLLNAQLTQQV